MRTRPGVEHATGLRLVDAVATLTLLQQPGPVPDWSAVAVVEVDLAIDFANAVGLPNREW